MIYDNDFRISFIIDPAFGASLITGGASLVGGLISNMFNKSSTDRTNEINVAENQKNRDFNAEQAELSRQFNAEESQKARDFNEAEAEKQRDWEKEMYDYQNEYNSPSEMLNRYKDAGLNPMLVGIDGQGTSSVGSGASASSSPASSSPASAPSSIPSQAFKMSDMFNDAVNSYWQAQLAKANVQNINANTKKTETETSWIDSINQNELDYKNVMIDKAESDIQVNESQRSVLEAQAKVFNEQVTWYKELVNEIQSKIGVLDEEKRGKEIENAMRIIEKENLPKKLALQNKLNESEAYNLIKQGVLAAANAQTIDFNLDVAKTAGKHWFVDDIRWKSAQSRYELRITKNAAMGTTPLSTKDKWEIGGNILRGVGTAVAVGFGIKTANKMSSGSNLITPSSPGWDGAIRGLDKYPLIQ